MSFDYNVEVSVNEVERCRTVAAGTADGSTAIAGQQTQARVVSSKLHPLQQQLGHAAMAATARPCVPAGAGNHKPGACYHWHCHLTSAWLANSKPRPFLELPNIELRNGHRSSCLILRLILSSMILLVRKGKSVQQLSCRRFQQTARDSFHFFGFFFPCDGFFGSGSVSPRVVSSTSSSSRSFRA